MGRKDGWFSYVKTFFIPDQKSKSNPKPEPEPESKEKPKKQKWFLKRFKFKRCSSAEAPRRMADEAAMEQRNRAMAVAIATASAADAAVAAANAAAEVVRLTTVVAPHRVQRKFDLLRSAAITIQTFYRAHLARKALCALKGIVKLQAVIRGEVTRRIVVARLSSMLDYLHRCDSRREEGKLHNNSHMRDFSLVSKEDSYLRRREAIAKKEHMRRYSSYTRDRYFLFPEPRRYDKSLIESAVVLKENRKKNWFDARKESEAAAIHSDNTTPVSMTKLMQLKLKAAEKCEEANEQSSTFSLPRRSHFQARKKSVGENESLPNSPIFPAYMAATKSAQAKCRSVSMRKQHLRLPNDDTILHAPYYTQCILSPESEMSNINRRNSISSLSERTIDPLIFLRRKRGHP